MTSVPSLAHGIDGLMFFFACGVTATHGRVILDSTGVAGKGGGEHSSRMRPAVARDFLGSPAQG